MNVKAWLAKADYERNDDYEAKNDRESNVTEFEFTVVLRDVDINLEIGKRENGENDGELGDANAS